MHDNLEAGRGRLAKISARELGARVMAGGGGAAKDPHARAKALPPAAGGKEGQDSQQQEMHTPTLFSSNHQEKLHKEKTHTQGGKRTFGSSPGCFI